LSQLLKRSSGGGVARAAPKKSGAKNLAEPKQKSVEKTAKRKNRVKGSMLWFLKYLRRKKLN
jgi:hypothetical protein